MYKNNSKKNNQKSGKGSGLNNNKRPKEQPVLKVALSRASKLINSKVVRDNLGTVRMSACAAKLASAIADPFSEEAKGACFPSYPAPNSHKVQAFTRFDGAIGTGGNGIIAINPCLANDQPSAYYSTAANAGSNIISLLSANDTLSTGVTYATHNGPYTSDQLCFDGASPTPPELYGRVVAVGVRVTYTGTTFNEAGTIALLSNPVHDNMTGVSNAGLQGFAETNICPYTRKPCMLSVFPASIQESSYPTANEASNARLLYPYGTSTQFYNNTNRTTAFTNSVTINTTVVTLGAPVALIMINGTAGEPFHVDITYHLEYAGKGVASAATPNSVDVSSVHAILTAASQLSTRKMAHPGERPWKLLMDGIRSAMGSPVGLTARGIVPL
jgi:hypothetical protein